MEILEMNTNSAFKGLIKILDTAKERISELEGRSIKITPPPTHTQMGGGQGVQGSDKKHPRLWGKIWSNTCITGIPEGKEKMEQKKYLKI